MTVPHMTVPPMIVPPMIVLGIETSCDETAAAVVDSTRRIRSNLVLSQLDEHRPYGGVVPENAARSHLDHLDKLVERALEEAGVACAELDGVAATGGPGLIGGVFVGVMTAKAIAAASAKPFLAVNHLEGHALSARLMEPLDFPYLLLLISGGHCQLLAVRGVGRYERYGTTVDDAVGEAFDKTAKLLGLGYPGGPAVERAAKGGDPARFDLPRPMLGRPGADFSFSGLKTSVVTYLEKAGAAGELPPRADVSASIQEAIVDVIVDKTFNAVEAVGVDVVGGGGGVLANRRLRERLAQEADRRGVGLFIPEPALCTDNGAMIASVAVDKMEQGIPGDPLDGDVDPGLSLGAGRLAD